MAEQVALKPCPNFSLFSNKNNKKSKLDAQKELETLTFHFFITRLSDLRFTLNLIDIGL